MERQILSVTELNNRVKLLVDCDPVLSEICVRGELSNYKIYPSGHHYFTLKDAESSLRCVMFRSSAARLRFRPENGMGVTAFGRVSVYTRDGAYQLYVNDLIPEGTGDLQVAFEQLKAKLEKEGLFDPAFKKPLPRFPRRIAVITSAAGAAVHDMLRILLRRWPLCEVCILPVRVQGTEAPAEIAGAIRYANAHSVADLIITGRGGGSIEDLWAFNDERVARAVFDSRIPVISAVGHEPDVTISDYVADVRASTPSNAAEIAVPEQAEIRETLSNYELRTAQAMKKKLKELRTRLDAAACRRVMVSPAGYADARRVQIDGISARLISAAERLIAEKRSEQVRLTASLDAMSPLKVLARGYAIAAAADGRAIKSVRETAPGDEITLKLRDGRLGCRVLESEELNHG